MRILRNDIFEWGSAVSDMFESEMIKVIFKNCVFFANVTFQQMETITAVMKWIDCFDQNIKCNCKTFTSIHVCVDHYGLNGNYSILKAELQQLFSVTSE